MKNDWLRYCAVLLLALGLVACASSEDDDSSGDGDADVDGDSDGDGDADACQPVEEEPPTCTPHGLDAAPERVEDGCDTVNAHTVTLDVMIKDTDARVHRDIAYPKLAMSISSSDPLTFPVSDSLQALVNGCEVPTGPTAYSWVAEADAFTALDIVLSAGKYYVFEIRERGAGGEGGARLFYRQALNMPSVMPNILTPATGEALPAPDRNVHVTVTWDPFDLEEATWATTKTLELHAWIQGGGAMSILEDPNILTGIDGTSGQVVWNAGAFNDWDFINMVASLFTPGQAESIKINVVRSVN